MPGSHSARKTWPTQAISLWRSTIASLLPACSPGQRSLGRFPDQYDDVHLAVLAARHDFRSNGKVGSVGGSAGATHTAWVAATGTPGDDRIDVGVGLSGAYDFSDFSPDPLLAAFIATVTNYVGVPETDTAALQGGFARVR